MNPCLAMFASDFVPHIFLSHAKFLLACRAIGKESFDVKIRAVELHAVRGSTDFAAHPLPDIFAVHPQFLSAMGAEQIVAFGFDLHHAIEFLQRHKFGDLHGIGGQFLV